MILRKEKKKGSSKSSWGIWQVCVRSALVQVWLCLHNPISASNSPDDAWPHFGFHHREGVLRRYRCISPPVQAVPSCLLVNVSKRHLENSSFVSASFSPPLLWSGLLYSNDIHQLCNKIQSENATVWLCYNPSNASDIPTCTFCALIMSLTIYLKE